MSTFSASVRYRPFRVGFCVQSGDITSVRSAIRLASCFWGGVHFPIIPCGSDRVVNDLISGFSIDGLYAVSEEESVARVIKERPHFPMPEFQGKVFVEGHDGPEPSLLSARKAIRELFEQYFRGRSHPELSVHLPTWERDDPLKDVFLARFGDYPSVVETGYDFVSTLRDRLLAVETKIGLSDALTNVMNERLAPLDLTRYCLDFHDRGLRKYGGPGIYVGDCTSFDDVVSFWNLRAAGNSLEFVDPTLVPRTRELAHHLCQRIVESAERTDDWRSRPCLWRHTNREPIEIRELDFPWQLCTVSDDFLGGCRIVSPQIAFPSEPALGHLQNDASQRVVIPLPRKPWLDSGEYSFEHLVASIHLIGAREMVVAPPYVPELNIAFGRRLTVNHDRVRAETKSVGVVIKDYETNVNLFPIQQFDLLLDIFQHAGFSISPSHAGRVARAMIKHLGDLQSCRAFKIAGLRELIFGHRHDQSFCYQTAMQTLGRLWKEEIYTNFHVTKPKRNKPEPGDILDFALDKGIFRIGVELRCGACEIASWWSIDDLKSVVECPWCGEPIKAAIQLGRPSWKLRRSGIFSDHESGGIPVIMVLQQIDTALGFDKLIAWTTGMDIEGHGMKCESDLAILSQDINHVPIVVLGECKRNKPIELQDVENLTTVARHLEAKGLRTAIIFAKLGRFTEAEIEHCRKANDPHRPRAILLSERELEPFWIYDLVPNDEVSHKMAHSIDDLIYGTLRTYLKSTKADQNP